MPLYFIRAGSNGPVKIGFSQNPKNRLRMMQIVHYEELSLLRMVRASKDKEREMHHKFRSLRIRGEWFTYCESMMGDLGLDDIPLSATGHELLMIAFTEGTLSTPMHHRKPLSP